MEHFAAMRNNDYQIVETGQRDIEILKEGHEKRWYVTDAAGCLRGYIGRREYAESVRQDRIVTNQKFTYLTDAPGSKEKSEKIFNSNNKISAIPVVSQDMRLLYEYVKDQETFYDELQIECGVNRKEKRKERIVVSLTTHGKRLEKVYLAIRSIMYQTLQADDIVLFLDDGNSANKIPHEDELVKAGLTIIRDVRNLGPHTKYYQAMSDFDDSVIITVDDDILYDDTVIEDLYRQHLKFPDAIVCRWGTRMKKKGIRIEEYNLWEDKVTADEPQIDICALGVGGCLYPCGSYRKKFLDAEGIINYCIGADDLWLKTIEMINGIKTISLGYHPIRIIRGSQEDALSPVNCLEKRNDKYILDVQKYLNIDLCEYFR